MNRGRALEQLVAHLEHSRCSSPSVHVHSPKELKDKATGESREFDVVLEFEHGHHHLITAIECKDWAGPIGSPEIEAFATKCGDCDIHERIIVSRNGFSEAGRTKAKRHNIRCLDFADVENFPWMKCEELIRSQWDLSDLNVKLVPDDKSFFGKSSFNLPAPHIRITNAQGLETDANQILSIVRNSILQIDKEKLTPKDGRVLLDVTTPLIPPLILTNLKTKAQTQVSMARSMALFKVTQTSIPFKLASYHEKNVEQPYGQIAYAPLEANDITGKIVMTHDPEKGTTISLLIDPK